MLLPTLATRMERDAHIQEPFDVVAAEVAASSAALAAVAELADPMGVESPAALRNAPFLKCLEIPLGPAWLGVEGRNGPGSGTSPRFPSVSVLHTAVSLPCANIVSLQEPPAHGKRRERPLQAAFGSLVIPHANREEPRVPATYVVAFPIARPYKGGRLSGLI
jgi:hypothetical protein